MNRLLATSLLLTSLLPATALADDAGYARAGRASVTFDFQFGLAPLDGFDEYATAVNEAFTSHQYEKPGSAIGAEIGVRYYAPYYIAAFIGASAMLSKGDYNASISAASTNVEYWNILGEVPILLGGHYPVHDRIHLHALVGPSVLAYSGSFWDTSSPAGLPDFEGDVGVGMQARLGADFYAVDNFAVGFEVMYRLAKTTVKPKEGTSVQTLSGKRFEEYELDFSGIGLTVGIRLVI